MFEPQTLTILGATGSIGLNTLAVAAQHPERFQLYAVTAHSNVTAMEQICRQHNPRIAVMADAQAAADLKIRIADTSVTVLSGQQALADVAAAADMTMAAIVGAAGLMPTMAAVTAGKRVLLANKEALVMSGQLFMNAVVEHGAILLPIDSEHNAIFQCLPVAAQLALGEQSLASAGISKIILTGSGGPFRELPVAELAQQSPQAACAHPNWSMGQKISVDSATMLNKGLEYIEARWLFNCQPDELDVLLHPQSIIHSMVRYTDGSVLAQMGEPDMRTPIAFGLSYPDRIVSGVNALDFEQVGALTFCKPDPARYPCLQLAQDACWQGQWATTSLNAANEIAVAAFLNHRIQFTAIADVCADVVGRIEAQELNSFDAILSVDHQARHYAEEIVEKYAVC
ncbi:1-deoxy-D-xylulose-5-phosphate reductoisomerase [Pseudidiomarina aestuarii]|uniref:1-deoxy-D-xylulose 5-phosphate reductoisomerase n=1 Tax=Pseudidiomarina aestuarii TaxID=624146 RepID=A0A2T4CTG2_9GAMM|nr:1-deoxy-D-xylulose-5-phosphate reductoisomerase [Pseudidiomarina aestuarii]PTB89978.1 1-deoxy-D-xylulose-5-phosphate reductoisomerase [Pseudidiomarina aestuarii]